jgi:hypothetical protein
VNVVVGGPRLTARTRVDGLHLRHGDLVGCRHHGAVNDGNTAEDASRSREAVRLEDVPAYEDVHEVLTPEWMNVQRVVARWAPLVVAALSPRHLLAARLTRGVLQE